MHQSIAESAVSGRERKPWERVIAVAVAGIALIVVAAVAAANWKEWRLLLGNARALPLFAALAAAIVGQFLNAFIAHQSLRIRGEDLRLRTVYRINALGGLAKFIPGGVWQIGSQYGLGRAAGLNFRKSMLAWIEPTAFNVTVGAGLALFAATTIGYGIPALLLIPGGLLALVASTNPVRHRLYRLLRLVPADTGKHAPFAGWPLAFAAATAIIALTGFGGMMIIEAFAIEPSPGFVGCVAAFVGAWVVGVLVFPVPGGLGIREGALVVALAPWLPAPEAVLIAAASRLVAVAAELMAAVSAILLGNDDPRAHATAPLHRRTPENR